MNLEGLNLKQNDTCYDKCGRCAVVKELLPGGRLLVRPVILLETEHSEEEGEGDYEIWHEAYPTAPKVKVDAEVNMLLAQKVQLQKDISDLRRDSMNAMNESRAAERQRIDIITRHEKLKRLEDFLERRITHIVKFCAWAAPEIIDITEWNADDRRRNASEGTKLLMLYGNSKGDINWRISNYRDESGCTFEATPCCSLEEAKELLKSRCLQTLDDFGKGIISSKQDVIRAIEALHHNGFLAPVDALTAAHAWKMDEKRAVVAKIEKDLELAKAQLAAAEAP